MNSRFVIIFAVIITVSIIAVFVIDSVNLDKLCAEKGEYEMKMFVSSKSLDLMNLFQNK